MKIPVDVDRFELILWEQSSFLIRKKKGLYFCVERKETTERESKVDRIHTLV